MTLNSITATGVQPKPVSAAKLLSMEVRTETDARLLVFLRCVLAFSAFAIVAAPSERATLTAWTLGPLALYCLYSLLVTYVWYRRDWVVMPRLLHWIDVLFYAYLIAVSGSTDSFFFMFFFYPILVSSFSWGFREGVMVTLVSTVMYATFGLAEGPSEFSRVLIPASGLLLFGYVISYLGVYEHLLRSRLALLKEINNPWNPRFGTDHVNAANLDALRRFYGATSSVLILRRRHSMGHHVMYTATADKPARNEKPKDVSSKAAEALLRLPDTLGAYYHDPEGPWWVRFRGYSAYDFELGAKTGSFQKECAEWLNLLEAQAFVTVPFNHDGTTGRLFLTSNNGWFTQADIDFLAQAADSMATVIENMYLIEELIAGAAESERLAMSRDLHDTTIQPYIGLKLALEGLYRWADTKNPLTPYIADLIEMADSTIHDLRNYAATLKDNSPMASEFLIDAITKQTERLRRFYGIDVDLKSEISSELKGRMAAEVFQIVAEGLSNVLRHTSAKTAFVNLQCGKSELVLEIGNEAEGSVKAFLPRTISERAKAMGGKVSVEQRPDRNTVVHVTVPMESGIAA
ncbi:MAG: sensor histidine kinase [Steroidobacteraceae bacterium]